MNAGPAIGGPQEGHFEVRVPLERPGGGFPGGRTGVIHTSHGEIQTPAFIPVGTKATVKSVLPEAMAGVGAQALLANAYHLYLQPGSDVVAGAGGLSAFMNWPGPTFTDSGGFQVLSLGAGFKKVLAMDPGVRSDEVIAPGKDRLATVDDDGVTFKSHLDGSLHRFTPEVSMRVQRDLGADIIFAFDECTTLVNTHEYQIRSLERTRLWAQRCIAEHAVLREAIPDAHRQFLYGVVQGAQYQDLRRRAASDLASLDLDGYGIGGALDKARLGEIVGWVTSELPEDRPRHLLGIGEPDDLFAAIEVGADTFDCVAPSRLARNGSVYAADGRFNIGRSANRRDYGPLEQDCECYTCGHYSRAYLHHTYKAKEMIGSTLLTIHNERFIVSLVDRIRESIVGGYFDEWRAEFLGRYYRGVAEARGAGGARS